MKRYIYILAINLLFFACEDIDDYKLSQQQLYVRASSAANDNNQIITSAEEVVDLTADVLIAEGITLGRTSSGRSNARSCNPTVDHSYLIDQTHYDTILYVGTMTIDYGDGESCTDADYKREGKIIDEFEYIINYKKEIFLSKETITFSAFRKDSVQLDGKFFIHSKSGVPVELETDKATITYPNGQSATWEGKLTFTTDREDGYAKSNTITGTISGITKRSEHFQTTIEKPLHYNYNCDNLIAPVPVEGSIRMDVNGEESSVDYGNGQCDNVYYLSVGNEQSALDL